MSGTETPMQKRRRLLFEAGMVRREVYIKKGDKRAEMTLKLIDRRCDVGPDGKREDPSRAAK